MIHTHNPYALQAFRSHSGSGPGSTGISLVAGDPNWMPQGAAVNRRGPVARYRTRYRGAAL